MENNNVQQDSENNDDNEYITLLAEVIRVDVQELCENEAEYYRMLLSDVGNNTSNNIIDVWNGHAMDSNSMEQNDNSRSIFGNIINTNQAEEKKGNNSAAFYRIDELYGFSELKEFTDSIENDDDYDEEIDIRRDFDLFHHSLDLGLVIRSKHTPEEPNEIKYNVELVDSQKECPICFEEITTDKELITKCNHRFHDKCINEWIKMDTCNACPICRKKIYKRNRDGTDQKIIPDDDYGRSLECGID